MEESNYLKILEKYDNLENLVKLFKGTEFIDDWECIYESFVDLFENELSKIYMYLDFRKTQDRENYQELLRRNNRIRSGILSEYSNLYKIKKQSGIPRDNYSSEIIDDKYVPKIPLKGIRSKVIFKKYCNREFLNTINMDNISNYSFNDIKTILLRLIYYTNHKYVNSLYIINPLTLCDNIINLFGSNDLDQEMKNLITNYLMLTNNYHSWKAKKILEMN